jgi:hypothetical protein
VKQYVQYCSMVKTMQDLLEEPPSPKLDIMIVQYLGKLWKQEGSIRRRRQEEAEEERRT